MIERSITTESLAELSAITFASLQRASDDFRSVCDVVDAIDSSVIAFDRSGVLHKKAACLRAQVTHALAAAASLSAAAASYELLGRFVEHSLWLPQVDLPPAAKETRKARSRKR
jgi:hypothetical protein